MAASRLSVPAVSASAGRQCCPCAWSAVQGCTAERGRVTATVDAALTSPRSTMKTATTENIEGF